MVLDELQSPSPTVVWLILAAFVVLCLVLSYRQLALIRVNRRLVQTNKAMEAARRADSEFLANVSHELRTPVHAILGFAALVQKRTHTAEDCRSVDAIVKAGKVLSRLVDDLSDLSRIDAGRLDLHPEPVDLRQLVAEVGHLYTPRLVGKGLELRVAVDPSVPPRLQLDETRIQQILLNLVGNALKFTERGEIAIGVRTTPVDARELSLDISVRDTGVGIAGEHHERVFEPFRQLDGPMEIRCAGVGLGLAICRRLAQRMGGEMRLESARGIGSTFTLRIPRVRWLETGDLVSPYAGGILRPPLSVARVLIADDDPLSRSLLREYLADQRLQVLEACDGEQALRTARCERPDLILMDIGMPRLDGIEVARMLKADDGTAAIPIIAVTAATMGEHAEQAASLCDEALSKPFSKQQVVDIIAGLLPRKPREEQSSTARIVPGAIPPRWDEAASGSTETGTTEPRLCPKDVANLLTADAEYMQSLAERLHVPTLQTLARLKWRLDQEVAGAADPPFKLRLEESADLAADAIKALRDLLFDLSVNRLLALGLEPALNCLASHLALSLSIPLTVHCDAHSPEAAPAAGALILHCFLQLIRAAADRAVLLAGSIDLHRLHSRWEVQLDLELDADLDRREVDTRLDVSRLAKVLGEGLAAADAGLSVVASTGGLRAVVMVPVVDDRGSTSRVQRH